MFTDAGASDPEIRADMLLGALTAEQVRHWRRDEQRPLAALIEATAAAARHLAQP
jgi:hypothetical protein